MRVKARAVDPIVSREEIEELKEYMLESSSSSEIALRNYMLVVIGINFGLRASDLCKLKLGDIKGREHLDIVEQKTGKRRVIFINEAVQKTIANYVNQMLYVDDNSYLFPSQKGEHITPKHIHKLIKTASRDLGWVGNYGSHSLRKTMAYHVLKNAGGDNPETVAQIMHMFNHSHERVTRRYLMTSKFDDISYSTLNL